MTFLTCMFFLSSLWSFDYIVFFFHQCTIHKEINHVLHDWNHWLDSSSDFLLVLTQFIFWRLECDSSGEIEYWIDYLSLYLLAYWISDENFPILSIIHNFFTRANLETFYVILRANTIGKYSFFYRSVHRDTNMLPLPKIAYI